MARGPGGKVKLFLVGALVGLVIGVLVTAFYFGLADFFRVQANAAAKASAELAKRTQELQQQPRAKGKAV
jgi:hypothetical protein